MRSRDDTHARIPLAEYLCIFIFYLINLFLCFFIFYLINLFLCFFIFYLINLFLCFFIFYLINVFLLQITFATSRKTACIISSRGSVPPATRRAPSLSHLATSLPRHLSTSLPLSLFRLQPGGSLDRACLLRRSRYAIRANRPHRAHAWQGLRQKQRHFLDLQPGGAPQNSGSHL